MLAAPPAEILARFEMFDDAGEPVPVDALPGRRALQGETPEPLIVRFRARGDPEQRWSRVKSTPVHDEEGRTILAINVIEDITEIKRSEEAQRFLAESGRVLAGLQRVAVAHVDPAKISLAEEFERHYPIDMSERQGLPEVLRTGRSELYADIPDEMIVQAARDEEHLAAIRSLGMRSAMIVPMALHGDVIGAITFVGAESGRRFGHADVELAESLATRAAVAVENARLYRMRSAIAQTLQASLLPPALPEVPGFELAAAYRPAGEGFDVGGDFYDVFGASEDQWYAVMGDVCGKGAEAAAVTALARYTIRAAAVRLRSPAAILRWLNDAMLRQQVATEQAGRFCTIACVHVDVSHEPARVTVACGGHPPPAVLRADGTVEELDSPGTLLGLFEGPDLQDRSGELRPGDTVVLYTDGLTESGAPERVWTLEELAATLAAAAGRPAAAIVEHLPAAALADVAAPRDDIALLALRATR